MSEPWVVHVIGPDDVLPATDMLDAIKQAHAINESAVGQGGYYDTDEVRVHMTFGWAVPKRESEIGSRTNEQLVREGDTVPIRGESRLIKQIIPTGAGALVVHVNAEKGT